MAHQLDSNRSSRSSSPAEERIFLENWQPEPLVPELDPDEHQSVLNPHVITSKPGKYIRIDGKDCLNLGTHNYLGLADDTRLEEASIQAARKYGVGACGPRAFYGTMDVHLKLEEELASFLGVEETVLYSFSFSTIASAIPAYAKATDVVFVDEYCNFAIQQGMIASKSRIIKFKHNNVEDLEQKIGDFIEEQREKYGKPKKTRTFLIVEGIYAKTGDVCPLNDLIEIKERYKIRLFIDESRSFGVLGDRGKGVTEHFGADINDVDLIMASLEGSFCAFGGFCAGSTFVIDHQRLAGAGYCFSASLPPLQVQVALTALNIVRDEPSTVSNAKLLFTHAHEQLKQLSRLKNISHPLSPIKILVIERSSIDGEGNNNFTYNKEDERRLEKICAHILESDQIAISISRYLEDEEMTIPVPSVRLIINACLEPDDINRVVQVINKHSAIL